LKWHALRVSERIQPVTYLLEIPVDAGGRLVVQASEDDLPGDLELAALSPGEIAARARESLEQALDQIKPAVGGR